MMQYLLLALVCGATSHNLMGNIYRHPVPHKYSWKTVFVNQTLDHFNFDQQQYTQRLLINADSWKLGGPLFFYTGNEGDIELFAQNTGFIFDIAPQFNAAVVFAEHRYYGASLPFGNASFSDPTKTKYLTVEQALADYADNIKWLKEVYFKDRDMRTVSFGGSYGGMLAAWIRMLYPSVVQGAISASAPVWMFPGMQQECTGPYQVITKVFQDQSQTCAQKVASAWGIIDDLAKTEAGRSKLQEVFTLCAPIKEGEGYKLSGWLEGMYFDMSMVNYPYPTSFLAPLPAWPVNEFCKSTSQTSDVLAAIAVGSQVYSNYTGTSKCLDINSDPAGGLGMIAWDFQACMELILPICSDPSVDMFPKEIFNIKEYVMGCEKQWNVTARPYWLKYRLGGIDGYNYYEYSQIFFSNGMLDPWAAGGVDQIDEPVCRFDCPTVVIEHGAHHLDMRAANPADPESVINARKLEIEAIARWTKRDVVGAAGKLFTQNATVVNDELLMMF